MNAFIINQRVPSASRYGLVDSAAPSQSGVGDLASHCKLSYRGSLLVAAVDIGDISQSTTPTVFFRRGLWSQWSAVRMDWIGGKKRQDNRWKIASRIRLLKVRFSNIETRILVRNVEERVPCCLCWSAGGKASYIWASNNQPNEWAFGGFSFEMRRRERSVRKCDANGYIICRTYKGEE
jgi:hypothetical protein